MHIIWRALEHLYLMGKRKRRSLGLQHGSPRRLARLYMQMHRKGAIRFGGMSRSARQETTRWLNVHLRERSRT